MTNIFNSGKKNNPTEEQEQNHNQVEEVETPQSFTDALSVEQEDKLEAVRDLLFGHNVKEYRNEFDELKRIIKDQNSGQSNNLSELKSDLVDKITTLENKFDDKINEMNEQILAKLDKLSDEKADRSKMAGILHDLASKLEE